jgi:hypothetical protein
LELQIAKLQQEAAAAAASASAVVDHLNAQVLFFPTELRDFKQH